MTGGAIRTFMIADVRGYTSYTRRMATRPPGGWLQGSPRSHGRWWRGVRHAARAAR